MFGFGSTDNDLQKRVDGITRDNVRTGELVDSAGQQITDIGNELGAVSDRVGNHERAAADIAGQIKDSRSLTKRSLELNRQAESILAGIEQRNKEPATQGTSKPD